MILDASKFRLGKCLGLSAWILGLFWNIVIGPPVQALDAGASTETRHLWVCPLQKDDSLVLHNPIRIYFGSFYSFFSLNLYLRVAFLSNNLVDISRESVSTPLWHGRHCVKTWFVKTLHDLFLPFLEGMKMSEMLLERPPITALLSPGLWQAAWSRKAWDTSFSPSDPKRLLASCLLLTALHKEDGPGPHTKRVMCSSQQ